MVEQLNQSLEDVEFTYRWYRGFLQRLLANGYEFRTFSDEIGSGDVLLRHDIDLSIDAAVRMARIEAELGIRSTYCVLLTSPLYNPFERQYREALHEIESLGHEIALHFSTHAYWHSDEPPDETEIERRVSEERTVLETLVSPTETVSFHRPPEWVLNRRFDGFESAYEPAYFSDIGYVADSNQRWREDPPLVEDLPETMQLLTHPGLWAEDDDEFAHRVKRAISDTRRHVERNTHSEFNDGEIIR